MNELIFEVRNGRGMLIAAFRRRWQAEQFVIWNAHERYHIEERKEKRA